MFITGNNLTICPIIEKKKLSEKGVCYADRCMRIYVGAATGEGCLGFPDGSSGGTLSAPSQQAEPETVEVCMGGCKYCGQFDATMMLPTLQLVSDPLPGLSQLWGRLSTPLRRPSHGIGLLPLSPQFLYPTTG